MLLGTDLPKLHAVVPPDVLPAEFGGTLTEAPSAWLDRLEAIERETGMLGGFAVPLRSDDPTGSRRREAAAAAKAAAGVEGAGGGKEVGRAEEEGCAVKGSAAEGGSAAKGSSAAEGSNAAEDSAAAVKAVPAEANVAASTPGEFEAVAAPTPEFAIE